MIILLLDNKFYLIEFEGSHNILTQQVLGHNNITSVWNKVRILINIYHYDRNLNPQPLVNLHKCRENVCMKILHIQQSNSHCESY